jgi:hypothetical protein
MVQAGKKGLYGAVLLGLSIVLSAAGCGSSSEAEPVTKAEFVKQANQICSSARSELEEGLAEAADGAAEPQRDEVISDVILPTVQQMSEDLGDLEPPKGDGEEVQAIVAGFEGGVQKVKANAGADLAEDVAAFGHADELAEEYGLTDCRI